MCLSKEETQIEHKIIFTDEGGMYLLLNSVNDEEKKLIVE